MYRLPLLYAPHQSSKTAMVSNLSPQLHDDDPIVSHSDDEGRAMMRDQKRRGRRLTLERANSEQFRMEQQFQTSVTTVHKANRLNCSLEQVQARFELLMAEDVPPPMPKTRATRSSSVSSSSSSPLMAKKKKLKKKKKKRSRVRAEF